ncbi:unnamed protein product [Dovyalis caffra]|uniref:DUF4378 domain-containing protein n=1 Tax=Dovyalis caffra TaxID=77055 RepID=A0AAV1RJN8_9ROSI|nr:unnamed protein product [Dovyalis caffra]
MASKISSSPPCKQKPFSIETKPLMLKDYLLDDLSSCSSNGFKSFPRRQCCTTVRFLLEIDLKTKHQQQQHQKQLSKRSRSSKAASTTISALQKASVAVINAVKLLPFPSSNSTLKSSSPSRSRKELLPRSLSRKLFKKSFWRKAADHHGQCKESNEIRGWRLFREFLEEGDKSSVQMTSRISTSSSSNSHSKIWTVESEFTVDSGNSTNSESCISSANDAVGNNKDLISDRVGVSVGQDSITSRKEWSNEEEKEQFSPVSILDCPFQDDEEEIIISSPFQRSLIRMEGSRLAVASSMKTTNAIAKLWALETGSKEGTSIGWDRALLTHTRKGYGYITIWGSRFCRTKQKLMQKIRRFESLAQLDPVDLEKRIAMAELEDESLDSPLQPCSMSIHSDNDNGFNETKENGTEKDAQELLKHVKSTIASHSLAPKVDSLLLDFFKEKIVENNASGSVVGSYKEFEQEVQVAQDWINGQPKELFLGWEVLESRQVYIKDMKKNGKWENVDQEKEEVALELEVEVFNSLVEEALLDCILVN